MDYEFFKSKSNNIGSFSSFLNNIKNKKYLDHLNSSIPEDALLFSIPEKLWYYLNSINLIQRCICNNKLSFIGLKNGYRKTCGNKDCYIKVRESSCLSKYGVTNPKKSKEVVKNEQEGIRQRNNGNHYMKDGLSREKFNNTMLNKYGVKWAQQSPEINKKSIETFLNNPDITNIINNRSLLNKNKSIEEKKIISIKKKESIENKFGSYLEFYNLKVKDSITKFSLSKYGVNHFMESDIFISDRIDKYKSNIDNKIISLLSSGLSYNGRTYNNNLTDTYLSLHCDKCNSCFDITRQLFVNRTNIKDEVCLKCNPISSGTSKMQLDLYTYVNSHVYSIDRIRVSNMEIDVYIPELKLGFEFNGLYWHSEIYKEKNYHLDKTKLCNDQGISLFHIWEDDWLYKQDIVKSMILNKLGKTLNKIFARKCIIKIVDDNKLVKDFLETNHIQGFVGSKIKIGLFYNDELVSLMTFGNLRKSLGQKSQEGSYELLRFCNKLNTTVVGGASKLFKYFLNNYDVKQVTSYSDLSRSNGNMYKQLGFTLQHNSDPNYYYIIDGIRKHRFNFRKDKLVKEGANPLKTEIQIMNEKGFYRIFDCGMQKWNFVF